MFKPKPPGRIDPATPAIGSRREARCRRPADIRAFAFAAGQGGSYRAAPKGTRGRGTKSLAGAVRHMKPTKDGRPGRSGKAPRGYAKGGEIPNIEGMPRIQKTKVLKGTGPQDPSVGPTAA